jgi:hypothetical protein
MRVVLLLVRRRSAFGIASTFTSAPPRSSFSLRYRMRFPSFRPFAAILLTFGGLPPAQEFQALRGLAVALVPPARVVDAVAPAAQADPQAEATPTSRKRPTESILKVSQGRCLLPQGPPERLLSVTRAFLLLPSSPLDERSCLQCN